MSLREISKEEADRLIESGEAGFYAVWANPPTPHAVQHVLQIKLQYWLVPIENLKIEKAGIVNLGGLMKQVHTVKMDLPDEISELLKADMERYQKIDVGVGIPAYHTQKLRDNS